MKILALQFKYFGDTGPMHCAAALARVVSRFIAK